MKYVVGISVMALHMGTVASAICNPQFSQNNLVGAVYTHLAVGIGTGVGAGLGGYAALMLGMYALGAHLEKWGNEPADALRKGAPVWKRVGLAALFYSQVFLLPAAITVGGAVQGYKYSTSYFSAKEKPKTTTSTMSETKRPSLVQAGSTVYASLPQLKV